VGDSRRMHHAMNVDRSIKHKTMEACILGNNRKIEILVLFWLLRLQNLGIDIIINALGT
jgi:hypothetical protein